MRSAECSIRSAFAVVVVVVVVVVDLTVLVAISSFVAVGVAFMVVVHRSKFEVLGAWCFGSVTLSIDSDCHRLSLD